MQTGRLAPAGIGAGQAAEIRLAWNGQERIPAALSRCELLLAIDRPDRLEVSWPGRQPLFAAEDGAAVAGQLPLPDQPMALRLGGELLFRGVVDRVAAVESCREPPSLRLSAQARWRFHLEAAPAEYYQRTPAEVAEQIAGELGLEAVVDAGGAVLPHLQRAGEPLRFLKELARRAGYGLAIAGERLYFKKDLSGIGRPHLLSPASGAAYLEIEQRRGGRRRGLVSLPRLALVRPLDLLRLRGFEPRSDGDYRAVRCRLRGGAAGWQTDLEVAGDGPARLALDLEEGGGLEP
ncbi:MAG: hypothetical protein HY717_16655 [Planctomycetes bacterium]|nr:hypothetical protein [Planctomycetota bacterium]